jgi:tryptophanyl-tRNA synthetase
MSLRDGQQKMSKSDPSDMSKILLSDTDDRIRHKIRQAKTDSIEGISYDPIVRPDVSNLVKIYACLAGCTVDNVVVRYATSTSRLFKEALAERICVMVAPIRTEIARLHQDKGYVHRLLHSGAQRARHRATHTLEQVHKIMGFR